jgi:hypothetical protein
MVTPPDTSQRPPGWERLPGLVIELDEEPMTEAVIVPTVPKAPSGPPEHPRLHGEHDGDGDEGDEPRQPSSSLARATHAR